MKRIVLAILAVYVAWSVLDFVIHGLILASSYEATAQLWRPMNEMKTGIMYLVVLINALAFVCIYALLVADKRIGTGVKYGLLFGLGTGVSMGFATYSFMPIPFYMAVAWFVGTLIETLVGGKSALGSCGAVSRSFPHAASASCRPTSAPSPEKPRGFSDYCNCPAQRPSPWLPGSLRRGTAR